jgi:hypothetical protein
MTANDRFPVTKMEALVAAQNAAWTETQRGCEYCDHVCGPPPRRLIHVLGSICGADWELDAALDLIRNTGSDGRVWAWSMTGHNLAVQDGNGKWWRFQVEAPTMIRNKWKVHG